MAKLGKISISKLSMVFLASILIPGLVLTYFGVQMVSYQRELTEKRLQERQIELCQRLSEQFNQQILFSADLFFTAADTQVEIHKATPQFQKVPFLKRVFKISHKGNFLYPYYLASQSAEEVARSTNESFDKAMRRAQQNEFIQDQLSEAVNFYQQAFFNAHHRKEKAQALNGWTRVLVKQRKFSQAERQYLQLAQRYGALRDEMGMPYVYYALHQLAQIAKTQPTETANQSILTILKQIYDGGLPFSEQFEIVSHEIGLAFSDTASLKDSDRLMLTDLLHEISAAQTFMQHNHALVLEYLEGKRGNVISMQQYDVLLNNQQSDPALLIMQSQPNWIIGFELDLALLRDRLIKNLAVNNIAVPLQVRIIDRHNIETNSNPYQMVRELSLYTPDWRIVVSPNDPQIIPRYIQSRRLLYGIMLGFLVLGMVLGVLLALRDLSRERRLSQLHSEFVSNVTHELKTPLTAIRMFAETIRLRRIRSRREQSEYLNIIVNETERLTRLINNVLDFSRIEREQKEYFPRRIDLSQILQSTLETLKYTLQTEQFQCKIEIENDLCVAADPDAIEQTILNLMTNAMKYSADQKEINVLLRRENDCAVLEIMDKGIGIPAQEQEKIFNKFYRGQENEGFNRGGAGLGLTVVKHIVAAHNGTITLTSNVNQGSTFRITLPLEDQRHGK